MFQGARSSKFLIFFALAILSASMLAPAQQLSDGTVYAGQPKARGFDGDNGQATSAELFRPTGLAFDSKGNLYIADTANARIRKVDAGTGVITTFAGGGQPTSNFDGVPATSAYLPGASAVAVDGLDNLYIFDFPRVLKVAATTGIMSTVVPSNVLMNFLGTLPPNDTALAVNRSGSTVWLAGDGQILKMDVASGSVSTFPTNGWPFGALAVAPNGDVVFAAASAGSLTGSINRIDATTGAVSTVLGPSVPALPLGYFPIALCVDASGNIYFPDLAENGYAYGIFQIHAGTNTISQVAASPSTSVPPSGSFIANSLAADPSGNIYFAERDSTVHRLAAPGPASIISANGVVNGASFTGPISAGSWFKIFGSNLSSGNPRIWGASDFVNGRLPTSLDGVGVTVNGVPAYIYYISSTQINAFAPEGTPAGQVTVQVTNSAGSSNSVTVTAQAEAPEFFRFSQGTGNYAAALLPNGTYIAAAGLLGAGVSSHPAKAGDVVELFAAGLGPTNPAFPDGTILTQVYPTQNPVTVTIGGQPATVQFAGMTVAGQYQVNAVVPQLPNGDVAVTISVNGASSQHSALISIQN